MNNVAFITTGSTSIALGAVAVADGFLHNVNEWIGCIAGLCAIACSAVMFMLKQKEKRLAELRIDNLEAENRRLKRLEEQETTQNGRHGYFVK